MTTDLIAGNDDNGRRLDRILRKALPDMPLSLIHRLLRTGRVLVDGTAAGADCRVPAGARICVQDAGPGGGRRTDGSAKLETCVHGCLAPEAAKNKSTRLPDRSGTPHAGGPIPAIIWQGAGLLAVNKPAGIAVHGSDRRSTDRRSIDRRSTESLDTQVQAYLAGKLPPSLSFKPGPLHRLDKPTSGIVVFSVTLEGAQIFTALLRERQLRKRYIALADGCIEKAETWEESLIRDRQQEKTFPAATNTPGAKPALTRALPLAVTRRYSLIMLEIETGRTHQIRAQAAFHGHPLSGDRKYGGAPFSGGLLLHAWSLEFPPFPPEMPAQTTSPPPELAGKTLQAPLPAAFLEQIRAIFGEGAINGTAYTGGKVQ
ncbi:RNA pseudouridine synthase [Spirochaetia bacterium]|nr:RNA pseudouridine synthase [Spirochaetia bacterium]